MAMRVTFRAMSNTLTQRALRLEDAAAITEIVAAIERVEPVDETLSEQDVLDELSVPGVDLDRASAGIFDTDRLVAFGWLRISPLTTARPEDPIIWKASQWAGVHPECVGRGLGHRVIEHLESCAAVMRDHDAPGVPGEMKIWLEEGRPRTARLAESMGYQTWRYFLRMRRDLAQPVTVIDDPPGVQIRQFLVADDEEVMHVSNASFADHWGSTPMDAARWRADFSDSSSFRPAHSRVATTGGSIMGFLFSAEFEADTRERGYPTGYIARVGTLRTARGRGIASALLGRTLQGFADGGYRFAELGVDAESPTDAGRLYERAGFVTISRTRVVGKRF
jgi:mycothiol synthase